MRGRPWEDADCPLLASLPLSAQTSLFSSPSSLLSSSQFFSFVPSQRGRGGWNLSGDSCSQGQGAGAAINELKAWGCRSLWLAEPSGFVSAQGASEGGVGWAQHVARSVAWQMWEVRERLVCLTCRCMSCVSGLLCGWKVCVCVYV